MKEVIEMADVKRKFPTMVEVKVPTNRVDKELCTCLKVEGDFSIGDGVKGIQALLKEFEEDGGL